MHDHYVLPEFLYVSVLDSDSFLIRHKNLWTVLCTPDLICFIWSLFPSVCLIIMVQRSDILKYSDVFSPPVLMSVYFCFLP